MVVVVVAVVVLVVVGVYFDNLIFAHHPIKILSSQPEIDWARSQWPNANRFDYQTNLIVSDKPNSAPHQHWQTI